jgi:branched-chain amino acid transport system permease protein
VSRFIERHPAWALIVLIAIALLLWLIFAVWPPGLRARSAASGIPQRHLQRHHARRLYFLVASGFTLIFGLMRNVNLAHGSLYLFGGYIGYAISAWTGSWSSASSSPSCVALVGVLLQIRRFRRMEGQDLRQTMVTIGLSIVFADLMLWASAATSTRSRRRTGWSARSNCRSSPPSNLRRGGLSAIPWCGW